MGKKTESIYKFYYLFVFISIFIFHINGCQTTALEAKKAPWEKIYQDGVKAEENGDLLNAFSSYQEAWRLFREYPESDPTNDKYRIAKDRVADRLAEMGQIIPHGPEPPIEYELLGKEVNFVGHRIKPNDTFSQIAIDYYGTNQVMVYMPDNTALLPAQMLSVINETPPDQLMPGNVIIIPPIRMPDRSLLHPGKSNASENMKKLKQIEKNGIARVIKPREQLIRRDTDEFPFTHRERVELNPKKEELRAVANRYYTEHNWDEAIAAFENLLSIDPGNKEAEGKIQEIREIISRQEQQRKENLYAEGIAHYEKGNPYLAFAAFKKLGKRDPYYKDVKQKIETIRQELVQQAESHQVAGEYDEAIAVYEKLIEADPEYKEGTQQIEALSDDRNRKVQEEKEKLYTEGETAYTNGELDEALSAFKRLSEIDPDYMDVEQKIERVTDDKNRQEVLNKDLYNTAEDYFKKSDWDQALVTFETLREIDPGYKDVQQKIERCKQEQLKRKTEMEALYNQGAEFMNNRLLTDAIGKFDEIMRYDSNYMEVKKMKCQAHYERGVVYYNEHKNLKKALEDFEEACKCKTNPEYEKLRERTAKLWDAHLRRKRQQEKMENKTE